MARGHGRILSSIWEDEDFLALTQEQQRLYLFLISQPNLNHAGLLPLTLRRWARKAAGLTAAELEAHLAALAVAGFIVMDEDTEELIIRSFVRNDGVWKQPKVMGAMVSGAMEIESRALRDALVAEMDRVPLEELSDAPTKVRGTEGPSIRAQVAEHIAALRKAFGGSGPGPSGGGYGTPSATPSGSPFPPASDPRPGAPAGDPHFPAGSTEHHSSALNRENAACKAPVEPLPQGGTDGDAEGPYARGRVRASRARTPAPAPAPVPSPVEEGGVRECGQEEPFPGLPPAPAARPDGRPTFNTPIDDDGFELNDAMRRWAATHTPGLNPDYETAQFIDHHRAEGRRRKNWFAEWQKWMRRSAKYASERAQRGSVVPFPGAARPSTTDARVQAALDLGRQMQAEADAAAAKEAQ